MVHELLTLNNYQMQAGRTVRPGMGHLAILDMCALGLGGESGECIDPIKKHLHHGKDLDREHMKKELGDVLWYVAVMSHELGFTLGDVAQTNIDKLRVRYPERYKV